MASRSSTPVTRDSSQARREDGGLRLTPQRFHSRVIEHESIENALKTSNRRNFFRREGRRLQRPSDDDETPLTLVPHSRLHLASHTDERRGNRVW